jgi:hypothetical protein
LAEARARQKLARATFTKVTIVNTVTYAVLSETFKNPIEIIYC